MPPTLPPAGPEPPANRDLASLVPAMQRLALQLVYRAAQKGIPLLVTEARRDAKRQGWLWSIGRTHSNPATGSVRILTSAQPGESNHESGRAIDAVPLRTVVIDGKETLEAWYECPHWERVGKIAESLGLKWGGRWLGKKHDRPHFQLPEGMGDE